MAYEKFVGDWRLVGAAQTESEIDLADEASMTIRPKQPTRRQCRTGSTA
jgi:hypothetical protein